MRIEEADAIVERVTTYTDDLLPGWCTTDKGKRIARVAAEAGAAGVDVAVELGVHGGRSLVALAAGLKVSGRCRIDGIDAYEAAAALEGDQLQQVYVDLWATTDYEATYAAARGALEKHGLTGYARVVRKRSRDAAADYTDGSIGLFHLDGNHSELVSCADMSIWIPKLAPKCVFICDDTNWPSMARALGMLQGAGFALVETGTEGYWSVFRR